MSLATRCAKCGTVFRVVQDQLKVSEGWVRCGRCSDVFNALEGMFDLDRGSAPNWTPSQRGALGLLPASAEDLEAQASLDDPTPEAAAVSETAEDGAVGTHANSHANLHADTHVDTRADSQIETRLLDADNRDDDGAGRSESFELEGAADDEPDSFAAPPAPTPEFLRRADNAARWRRPRVRLSLTLAAALLASLLAAQVALLRHDEVAARWPQSTEFMELLCGVRDCRIEPLRRLDGLAVESSGLAQLGNATQYRLQVSLRNRDALPLLTPALDLTLTDTRGAVVARKVLRPADFGAATPTVLAAGTELTLLAVLDTGEQRVSGYSVEIFYP